MKRTAPLLRIFLAVLAAVMAVAPVAAFQVARTAQRFEGKVVHDPSATLNAIPLPAKDLEQGSALRAGWDLFRSEYGDGWDITVDGRSGVPTLVQGQGIPWIPGSGNSLQSSAAVNIDGLSDSIKGFMRRHATLLATNVDEMELSRTASGEMGGELWTVVYDRKVNNIPVLGDTYVFYIGHGNLISFGSQRWGSITPARFPPSRRPRPSRTCELHGAAETEPSTVYDAGTLVLPRWRPPAPTSVAYNGGIGRLRRGADVPDRLPDR